MRDLISGDHWPRPFPENPTSGETLLSPLHSTLYTNTKLPISHNAPYHVAFTFACVSALDNIRSLLQKNVVSCIS